LRRGAKDAVQDRADARPQFGLHRPDRAACLDDLEPEPLLEAAVLRPHPALVGEETVEPVVGHPEVHAGFPVVEHGAGGERALDQLRRGNGQEIGRIRYQRLGVERLEPLVIDTADRRPRDQREDVAIGEDHRASVQRRHDPVLELVVEIRGVEERRRPRAEDVPPLGGLDLRADELGAAKSDLRNRVPLLLQPLTKQADLGRSPRGVRALDHYQGPVQTGEVDPRERGAKDLLAAHR
jgi:hypothetical protein